MMTVTDAAKSSSATVPQNIPNLQIVSAFHTNTSGNNQNEQRNNLLAASSTTGSSDSGAGQIVVATLPGSITPASVVSGQQHQPRLKRPSPTDDPLIGLRSSPLKRIEKHRFDSTGAILTKTTTSWDHVTKMVEFR